jgi:hypothetical protein
MRLSTAMKNEVVREQPELPSVVRELLFTKMRRASGDIVCTLCGLRYRDHKQPLPVTCPTLVILCSGDPIKL